MNRRILLPLFAPALLLSALNTQAQQTDSVAAAPADTVAADSTHSLLPDGTVRVILPDALLARLHEAPADEQQAEEKDETATPAAKPAAVRGTTRPGYRIQVFDDNNARTAKREAQSRKSRMESRFPEYRAYISFNSPYWRLKVGDFTSRSEAEAAMAAIRQAFPDMAGQLRVVRDKVNVR